jgi:hypothetical protein
MNLIRRAFLVFEDLVTGKHINTPVPTRPSLRAHRDAHPRLPAEGQTIRIMGEVVGQTLVERLTSEGYEHLKLDSA